MIVVVEIKKSEIDNVYQKLKQYEDVVEKVKCMLNCVEIILVFLSELGVDVNKVKVNRDIVKVSWNLRFLLFVFYVYFFNMFFI